MPSTVTGLPSTVSLERLLATNKAPLEIEMVTLEQAAASDRGRIERLRVTIAELRAATERGIEELEQAEKSLKAHSIVLSAVRRVPAEVLCEIFALTLPHTQRVGKHTVDTPPWRLGHICQRWRAVALGYAPLWASITILASKNAVSPRKIVETQLRRSGNAPVTLTLDIRLRDANLGGPDLLEALELCLPHSHRWKVLRLNLLQELLDQSMDARSKSSLEELVARVSTTLLPIKGRLDILHTLQVYTSNHWTRSVPSFVVDTFSIAPRLREVILADALYGRFGSPDIQLPLSQITRFRGYFGAEEDVFDLLRAAPRMVTCGIRIGDTRSSSTLDPPHITLSHLRSLSVESPHQLFTFITTPALQELWVSGNYYTSTLHRCIQQSSPPLVKLVIHNCLMPARIVTVLESLPALTTFFVQFAEGTVSAKTRPLFDALKITAGSATHLCPNLSHLAAGGPASFGIIAFVNMAASRWYEAKPSPLAFVRAFYGHDVSSTGSALRDVVDCLRKMKAEGVDAEFVSRIHMSPESFLGFGRP